MVSAVMRNVLLVGLLVFASTIHATVAADDSIKNLKAQLSKLLPGEAPDSITETPIPGIYEVIYGAQLLYFSADGRYLLKGDIMDMETRKSLGEPRRNSIRAKELARFGDDQVIMFSPDKDKVKHTVTVFTDIDCGYCRKLHAEIDQYNQLGIAVRYMMFPRSGPNSPSFDKAVSVWCADDRPKALTNAKKGSKLDKQSCDNPIMAHYSAGQAIGLRGTPGIVLESGEMMPGYVAPEKLSKYLDTGVAN